MGHMDILLQMSSFRPICRRNRLIKEYITLAAGLEQELYSLRPYNEEFECMRHF